MIAYLTLIRRLPHLPWSLAPRVDFFKELPVLESIHAGPVTVILMCDELLFPDEPLEWLLDEFFTLVEIYLTRP